MEIIKRGKAHKWKAYYCECPLCGTQVRILKGDPDIERYRHATDSFQESITWRCPECLEEVLTKTSKDHYGSGEQNIIKYGEEVISLEDKKLIESWKDTINTYNPDNAYCIGIWDSNNH